MESNFNQNQQSEPVSNQPTNSRVGLWWSVVIIIIVAVLVGVYFFLDTGRSSGDSVDLGNGRELIRTRNGDIVKDFPNNLLFEDTDSIEIVDSFQINYDGGASQPVVKYASSKNLLDNIVAVRKELVDDGWFIVKEANPDEGSVTNFYAVRNSESVNVTFSFEGKTVIINVAYASE